MALGRLNFALVTFSLLSPHAMMNPIGVLSEEARDGGATRTCESRAARSSAVPEFNTSADLAWKAARDTAGGRFEGIKQALAHPDYRNASASQARAIYEGLVDSVSAVAACRAREADVLIKAAAADTQCDDICLQWEYFHELMLYADSDALGMADLDVERWRSKFATADREDRRYWGYRFMYEVYSDLISWKSGFNVRGGALLHSLTKRIFGSDAAYSLHQIRSNALAGKKEKPRAGRPANFPEDAEEELFRFAATMRMHKWPCYKSFVIEYAKRLLAPTEYALNFAREKDGEFVLDKEGWYLWDETKLSDWFHRRFSARAPASPPPHLIDAELPPPPCLSPHAPTATPPC